MQFIVKTAWADGQGKHAVGDPIEMDEALAGFALERGYIARPDLPAQFHQAAAKRVVEMQVDDIAQQVVAELRGKKKNSWKKWGWDWLAAARRYDSHYLQKWYGSVRVDGTSQSPLSMAERKAALISSDGAAGAYLVPTAMAQPILSVAQEWNWLRKRALAVTMSSSTLDVPLLDITSLQATGQSPFTGGFTFRFVGESQPRQQTQSAYKGLFLRAWELSGFCTISHPLWDDSVALQSHLTQLLPQALAYAEIKAFLTGNGIGQPLGVLNSPAALNVTRQAVGQITYADAASMIAQLPPACLEFAVWACSPSALPQLLELRDAATGQRAVLLQAGLTDPLGNPKLTLLGLPVKIAEPLPALGARGDLMLLDPYFYVIGDRVTLEIAASETPGFLTSQTVLRVIRRLDGQPRIEKPITLQDGATQVSPFVILN